VHDAAGQQQRCQQRHRMSQMRHAWPHLDAGCGTSTH
jgi:hypothetical protein